MDKLVKLYNVVDIRTQQFHSVAVVKERNAKYYKQTVGEEED